MKYEEAYDQELFPLVGSCGPLLNLFLTAEKNLIDLSRVPLNVEVAIYLYDGKKVSPGEYEGVR